MARESEGRFVGLDLGKRKFEAAFVEGKAVRFGGGETAGVKRAAFYRQLRMTDTVVLEAGGLAFTMAKEMKAQVGCKVLVLDAGHLAVIYRSMKKTDKEDCLKLAHLAQYMPEEQLPVVAIPSDDEMERREITSEMRQTKRDRNRVISELHALFVKAGITTVVRKNLATDSNRKVAIEQLGGRLRVRADFEVKYLEMLDEEIGRLEKEMEGREKSDVVIQRLETIPGVGLQTAFAFTAYVDVERFSNASQVSNYVGLVPRVDISSTIVKYGRITKRGNGYLRGLLNQASWSLVLSKSGGALKERYEYMTKVQGKSKKKSIVAVSRKLVELMYTMVRGQTNYETRKFVPEWPRDSGRDKYVKELASMALA